MYRIRILYTSIRSLHQDNGWFCAFANIILEICGLLTTCSAWHNHGWNPPFRAFPKSNLILPGARSLEGVLPKKMPSNSQLSTSWQLATRLPFSSHTPPPLEGSHHHHHDLDVSLPDREPPLLWTPQKLLTFECLKNLKIWKNTAKKPTTSEHPT